MFSFEPALLVLIDGDPSLKPAGVAGVERVVNTRSLLLKQRRAVLHFICQALGQRADDCRAVEPVDKVAGALEQAKAKAVQAKLVDVLDQPEGELRKPSTAASCRWSWSAASRRN